MPQPEKRELPETTRQSLQILDDIAKRCLRGEIDEIAIVAITPLGEVITAYSETESVVRMGGALTYAGMRRMGFATANLDAR